MIVQIDKAKGWERERWTEHRDAPAKASMAKINTIPMTCLFTKDER